MTFWSWLSEKTGMARIKRHRSEALRPANRMFMERFRNDGLVKMIRLSVFITAPVKHINTMTQVKNSDREFINVLSKFSF